MLKSALHWVLSTDRSMQSVSSDHIPLASVLISAQIEVRECFYHSVQNLPSSSLLYKNIKIETYTSIILSVVLYGCGTCSLTLGEESKLRVFENRVLRRIFGPNREGVPEERRKYIQRSLMVCTPHQILFG